MLPDDHPQRRPVDATTRRPPAYIGLRRPVGQQAERRPHLARRRAGAGARLLVDAAAPTGSSWRTGGRPGVEATWADPRRRAARRSPCAHRGSSSRPARSSRPRCSLRSGIGGPAVGRLPAPASLHCALLGRLRRRPGGVVGPAAGRAGRRVRRRRRRLRLPDRDGPVRAGRWCGSATPFTSGADHKERMSQFRLRRHVHRAGARPRARPGRRSTTTARRCRSYAVTDERRRREPPPGHRRARRACTRRRARAQISALADGLPTWRRGRRPRRPSSPAPARSRSRAGGHRLFSAHQMGTCRMGADPQTSVADPRGELHDTPGVWIGDASAFPTSSGTNPMITIMALAHRTAEAIAAAAGEPHRRPGRRRPEEQRTMATADEHPTATASTSAASGSIPARARPIEVINSDDRGGDRRRSRGHRRGRRPRGRRRARRLRGLVAERLASRAARARRRSPRGSRRAATSSLR